MRSRPWAIISFKPMMLHLPKELQKCMFNAENIDEDRFFKGQKSIYRSRFNFLIDDW